MLLAAVAVILAVVTGGLPPPDFPGGWHFAGGAWTVGSDGALSAPPKVLPCGRAVQFPNCTHPTGASDANVAFFTGRTFVDFEASFDFVLPSAFSAAGLVFHATSAQDYKVLLFPENGIEARDSFVVPHLTSVDGSGWARTLHSERLADVTSASGIKHTLLTRLQGGLLEAFFDGHPLMPVRLPARGGGALGLLTYALTSADRPATTFSNLNFTALPAEASVASGVWSPPKFNTILPSKLGTAWSGIDMAVAPASGGAPGTSPAVLIPATGEVLVGAGAGGLIASSDQGFSWRKLPCGGRQYGNGPCGSFSLRGNNLHNNLTHVEGYTVSAHRPAHWVGPGPDPLPHISSTTPISIHKTVSKDGINWGPPTIVANITAEMLEATVCTGLAPQSTEMADCKSQLLKPWKGTNRSIVEAWAPDPGMRLELPDGSQVWTFSFTAGAKIVPVNGRSYWAFGGPDAMPGGVMASIRSTSSGDSWEAPVNMDDSAGIARKMAPMDDTGNWEATAAYTHRGAVFAYAPGFLYDPWSAWSFTAGTSWQPVTRGALLVCAHANSALTTKSGVVLVAGRFPGIALMVSWDDAMSWDSYIIDTSAFAANGALVELEPDLVLYIYGGSYSPAGYRTQLFKVDRQSRTATPVGRGPDGTAGAPARLVARSSTQRPLLRRTVVLGY